MDDPQKNLQTLSYEPCPHVEDLEKYFISKIASTPNEPLCTCRAAFGKPMFPVYCVTCKVLFYEKDIYKCEDGLHFICGACQHFNKRCEDGRVLHLATEESNKLHSMAFFCNWGCGSSHRMKFLDFHHMDCSSQPIRKCFVMGCEFKSNLRGIFVHYQQTHSFHNIKIYDYWKPDNHNVFALGQVKDGMELFYLVSNRVVVNVKCREIENEYEFRMKIIDTTAPQMRCSAFIKYKGMDGRRVEEIFSVPKYIDRSIDIKVFLDYSIGQPSIERNTSRTPPEALLTPCPHAVNLKKYNIPLIQHASCISYNVSLCSCRAVLGKHKTMFPSYCMICKVPFYQNKIYKCDDNHVICEACHYFDIKSCEDGKVLVLAKEERIILDSVEFDCNWKRDDHFNVMNYLDWHHVNCEYQPKRCCPVNGCEERFVGKLWEIFKHYQENHSFHRIKMYDYWKPERKIFSLENIGHNTEWHYFVSNVFVHIKCEETNDMYEFRLEIPSCQRTTSEMHCCAFIKYEGVPGARVEDEFSVPKGITSIDIKIFLDDLNDKNMIE